MSGIHLTLEESIKLNLGRIYGFHEHDKIVLSNPRTPAAGILPPSDRMIDVEYKGKHYTVCYKRFSLADILGNFNTAAQVIVTEVPLTFEQISEHFINVLGVNLPVEYIDQENTVPALGTFDVVIKSDCHWLTGTASITAGEEPVVEPYPKPLHEWLLMGNNKNTGTSTLSMTAPFKYVRTPTGMWGTLTGGKTPQAFGDGIELPTTGNWTLDFEFMIKSVSAYNSIFHESVPGAYVPGCLCFYNGGFYESHLTHAAHGKKVPINTVTRHTVVCKNNRVDYYYNGVKVESWSTQASRKAFRCFRNTGGGDEQFAEDISHMRKLRFWDITLEGTDLDNLFNAEVPPEPDYPVPEHEWLLNGSYANTGNSTKQINNEFKFVDLPSGTWATLKGGRTPKSITQGAITELPRTGDWCVDFEMLVKERPIRNVVFTPDGADANGGHIMFYTNMLYEPYGNSSSIHTFEMPVNVPTRHTLRCVNKTIYYYMDGLLAQSWPSASTQPWRYFRSSFATTEQMEEDKTYLRKIRFWQNGLSDIDFQAILNNDGYADIPPVHNWPLAGDNKNIGTSKEAPLFAPPIAYAKQTDGTTMANLTGVGHHPLGTSYDGSKDWTISVDMIDPTPGLKGFLNAANMLTPGLSSMIYQKKLTVYLGTSYANLWIGPEADCMVAGKKHTVVMTKRGLAFRMYVDGKLVQRCDSTAAIVGAFTHFGAYNGTASFSVDTKFSNLRIYDYGATVRQVRQICNRDRPVPLYALPDQEWMLNGKPDNTGKGAVAFQPPVAYEMLNGKQFATLTGSGLQPFGVDLPTNGNWTLDFTIFYKSMAEYEHLFAGLNPVGQSTYIKMRNGKLYEADCPWVVEPTVAIQPMKPYRVTMVSTNNDLYVYIDGTYVARWTTTLPAKRASLYSIRTAGISGEGNLASNVAYIRAFRFYNRALSVAERTTLFLCS